MPTLLDNDVKELPLSHIKGTGQFSVVSSTTQIKPFDRVKIYSGRFRTRADRRI